MKLEPKHLFYVVMGAITVDGLSKFLPRLRRIYSFIKMLFVMFITLVFLVCIVDCTFYEVTSEYLGTGYHFLSPEPELDAYFEKVKLEKEAAERKKILLGE